jgi:hypothetical protein
VQLLLLTVLLLLLLTVIAVIHSGTDCLPISCMERQI